MRSSKETQPRTVRHLRVHPSARWSESGAAAVELSDNASLHEDPELPSTSCTHSGHLMTTTPVRNGKISLPGIHQFHIPALTTGNSKPLFLLNPNPQQTHVLMLTRGLYPSELSQLPTIQTIDVDGSGLFPLDVFLEGPRFLEPPEASFSTPGQHRETACGRHPGLTGGLVRQLHLHPLQNTKTLHARGETEVSVWLQRDFAADNSTRGKSVCTEKHSDTHSCAMSELLCEEDFSWNELIIPWMVQERPAKAKNNNLSRIGQSVAVWRSCFSCPCIFQLH